MKTFLKLFIWIFLLNNIACVHEHSKGFSKLTGSYLGQKPPCTTPEIFSPGIITTPYQNNCAPAFSADMNEVYWSVSIRSGTPGVILFAKRINNKWTEPQVVSFSGQYDDGGPFLSPDNHRLFFHSSRPLKGKGEPKDRDIWFVVRTESGWGEPTNAGRGVVNTEKNESYPSVSKNGTLYFNSYLKGEHSNIGIFKSKIINGEYTGKIVTDENINSPKGFNWCPFIDPDEKYILFSSGRDGQEYDDLYCSFKNEDDTWREPLKLNAQINSDFNDRFPRMSPDGRYLFFARPQSNFKLYYQEPKSLVQLLNIYSKMDDDIYWIDASFIKDLRKEALKDDK